MANIYEGNKPFVFISYAHKDTARVLPIVEALVSKGIRVWYDAGIEAGSEWPEYIATHLKSCACTLCFISQNYDISDNCRRELTYALNCKRPTMSVYLDPCQLSDGLELQLGLVQAIFCNRFSTLDLLTDSLAAVPMIAACRADACEAEDDYTKPIAPIPVQQTADPAVTNFLKRAALSLEDGDWDDAIAFCEQALNIDVENTQAYLITLLAEMKVTKPEHLASAADFSENNKQYKKLLRFADQATKDILSQALEKAKEKAIAAEKERIRARHEAAEDIFRKNATIKNGVLERYFGNETDVYIPYSVTCIGKKAFYMCKSLTSVTIPHGVTCIEEYAFAYCEALTSVTIPDSVTTIGKGAFSGCKSLTAVTIPKGVSSIAESCFIFCETLTALTIPDGVTHIARGAFCGCKKLTALTIPDSVTTIGREAFELCESLTSVTIPGSINQMEMNPFAGCNRLTEILVSGDTPHFTVRNGHLIDTRTNTLMVGCANAPIPDDGSVTTIGKRAFDHCKMLTSVTIPEGVTHIDNHAFYCCRALASLTLPGSLISIGDHVFCENERITTVTLPAGLTTIGVGAFSYCRALSSMTIPANVIHIEANPFNGCNNLTEIAVSEDNPYFAIKDGHLINTQTKTLLVGCADAPIPNDGSVTAIGNRAFDVCEALSEVIIPYGVTSIGEFAFSSCKALTSVNIPNTVTSIGMFAFLGCKALTSIILPKGITTIEERVFSGCDALRSVFVPGSVTAIAQTAFDGCKKVTIFAPENSFAWQWAENERIMVRDDAIIKQDYYQSAGLCQYCGGKFKGLLRKKCVSCGKLRDY